MKFSYKSLIGISWLLLGFCNEQKKGQTLVEVLVAMGIAVIGISAIGSAVVSGLNNGIYSKNQHLATQYAQEGMDIIKQLQISNVQAFTNLSGRYCLAQTCATLVSGVASCGSNDHGNGANCVQNVNNFFIRQVDILPIGSANAKCVNTMQATVSVLWTDGKCPIGTFCHNQQVVACFSNVNAVATP